jgi:hypothetical protein
MGPFAVCVCGRFLVEKVRFWPPHRHVKHLNFDVLLLLLPRRATEIFKIFIISLIIIFIINLLLNNKKLRPATLSTIYCNTITSTTTCTTATTTTITSLLSSLFLVKHQSKNNPIFGCRTDI